jgi:N-formylglutamate deformylase
MATAIHAGHELRPEIAYLMSLDEAIRLREEDPYTDRLTDVVPLRVVTYRSRFEVDLNRARDAAFYLQPDAAWGLEIWRTDPPPQALAASLEIYDSFYESISQVLDRLALAGRFAVLDIHSYNHRRDGPDKPPAPTATNPDINIGTGSLDRSRWENLIDRFAADLAAVLPPTTSVDENVRFKGGYFSQWIDERYSERGCALAIEFKKTFMNEWDGTLDEERVGRLKGALAATIPGVVSELRRP